jgi:hypothetical protein
MYRLTSPSLSVCLFECNSSRTAERVFMKFYARGFYLNLLTNSSFGFKQTTVTGTLHENLQAFLRAEVTGPGLRRPGLSRGASPPIGLGNFRGLSPLPGTPRHCPHTYYTPGLFNPWGFTAQALPQNALRWGQATSDCCFRGFAPRATSPLTWPPGLDTPVLPPSWLEH